MASWPVLTVGGVAGHIASGVCVGLLIHLAIRVCPDSLAVASLAIPVVGEVIGGAVLADTAIGVGVTEGAAMLGNDLFYADTALSIADARYTCSTGSTVSCAVGVASVATGAAGYAFGAGAKAAGKLAGSAGSAIGRWAYRQASRGLNIGAWLQNIASLGYSIAGGCNLDTTQNPNQLNR
jgi:hypothetical protein